jgi:hypothetical protein
VCDNSLGSYACSGGLLLPHVISEERYEFHNRFTGRIPEEALKPVFQLITNAANSVDILQIFVPPKGGGVTTPGAGYADIENCARMWCRPERIG